MSIQTVRTFKMVSPMSEIMQATKCLICDNVYRICTGNISENPVAASSISQNYGSLTNKAFSPSAITRAVWKLFYEAFGIKLDPSYFSSSADRQEFFDAKAPPVCIACCNNIRQQRILQGSQLKTITDADNQPVTLISTARRLQEEYESVRSAIIMGLCQVELNEDRHNDHENGKSVTATTTIPTKVTNKIKNKVTNNNRNRSNILHDTKSPNKLTRQTDIDTNTEIKPHITEVITNASKPDPGEAPILMLRETVTTLINTLTGTDFETDVANLLTETKELLQLPIQSLSANRPVLSALSLETTEHRFNKDMDRENRDKMENHEPNGGVSFSKIIQQQVPPVSPASSKRVKSKTKKPQQCKLCTKTVCSTESLKVHMRTHTGEKPFVCFVCSRKFSDRSNLIIHKKLHTQILEHPCRCETCGKRYVNGARLRVHMRTHTGEVPYPCDECSQSFATSSLRTRHKIKAHLSSTRTRIRIA